MTPPKKINEELILHITKFAKSITYIKLQELMIISND